MANFDYNKIILGGRLTGDPELRQTASGVPVTTFSMAVNRHHSSGENEATFFRVTAWQTNAEFVARNFRKGDSIFITGRADNKKYTDSQGLKHSYCEITAEEVKFVDGKKDKELRESNDEPSGEPAGGPADIVRMPDEDLPF